MLSIFFHKIKKEAERIRLSSPPPTQGILSILADVQNFIGFTPATRGTVLLMQRLL